MLEKQSYRIFFFNFLSRYVLVVLIDFEKNGVKLEAGGVLPTGRGNLKIKAVTDTMVTIYNNHPLAGKTLNFDIEINSFIN